MRHILIALAGVAVAGCATDPWAIQNYMVVVVQARKIGAANVIKTASPAPEAKPEDKSNTADRQ